MKYPLSLLQAINDWQYSGEDENKKVIGDNLKEQAKCLDSRFRSTNDVCYRKIDLSGKYLFDMGLDFELKETLSSWTKSLEVACSFKGGVPPKGWTGVIYQLVPSSSEVIIDLSSLMNDQEFIQAVEFNKAHINNYEKGIGLYKDFEKEVVVEIQVLKNDGIFAYGGFSSIVEGKFWLAEPEAVRRVNEKLSEHAKRLNPYRK